MISALIEKLEIELNKTQKKIPIHSHSRLY